jgi:hypothetical protein
MTQPRPKVTELHDKARQALDELRGELSAILHTDDLAPFIEIAQKAEDAIDEADAYLQRAVTDIEDAARRILAP